ncbi:type II/IV secretion system ATPase subunit [Candidatus Woesearchaeota archaeon]|nr:type II/IV secretion system ATPase subunit [Candidatus Woesearchaeota archaeon]
MAISQKKLNPGEYEIIQEGEDHIMRINFFGLDYPPSLEDNNICMASVINDLIESPNVSRIIFSSDRNYQYNNEQTQMLREFGNIYVYLTKQRKILSLNSLGFDPNYPTLISDKIANIQYIVTNLLKSDPVGAYVDVKRQIREQKIKLNKPMSVNELRQENLYLNVLEELFGLLDKTKLIELLKNDLDGHQIGNRRIYSNFFRPAITPNFVHTRLMAEPPMDSDEIDSYIVDENINIMIFNIPEDIKSRYHVIPPEFNLSEDKLELLDLARSVLSEHEPVAEEFTNPERMRETFFNIGKDLISELADQKNIRISFEEIEILAGILVRYTVGFGLLEVLLKDEKIQDLVINGPIGESPIYIVHQDYGECSTNIIPSREDGESWATKFRMISGRPLDEANPVLDTELLIPGARARVAIITNPLNPYGLGYALRRHRDNPWTLPLFMNNKMINSLGAALLSFIIDGSRTLLIAGTRSSGKTSLLGSLMVEIMRKYRVITVEDTLELPVRQLRRLGYNIQPMKVRSSLSEGGAELAAEEGIRASLRMGDSSLIVGEVRSREALALYEAMRIGALANVVAGTIHGGSPYSVFDRVVNDLGVPRTSFKATDIIVVVNPIKTPDGLKKVRRVLSITEVRKEWENDPLREGGFVDLMLYNPETDQLEPTDNLMNGDSEIIKQIAANVKEWAGNWDAVWENILLRKELKEELLTMYNETKNKDILEAQFVVMANDAFHKISDEVLTKYGMLDNKKISFRWKEWLKKEMKKRNI